MPKSWLVGTRHGNFVIEKRLPDRTAVLLFDDGQRSICNLNNLSGGLVPSASGGHGSARGEASLGGPKKVRTAEYRTWLNMKNRCNNVRGQDYHYYGGRGISVCPEWNASFTAFLQDMGRKPTHLHTIERVDNNAGYTKANCKWATRAEQIKNRRWPR